MSTPPEQVCLELINRLGLDATELSQDVQETTGQPLNLHDPLRMLTQIVELLLFGHNVQAQILTHLAAEHDALRNDFAQAQAKLHKAHNPVARAATQYRDETLARLARDVLTGTPRREALDQKPTATQQIRLAAANLKGPKP